MRYATIPGDDERALEGPADGTLVVEFWNARCARCPRALEKVRELAREHDDVSFLCMNLSVGHEETAERAYVHEVSQDEWPANVRFGYMSFARKEQAKRALDFATLPFCAVFVGAEVVYKGDPLEHDALTSALTTRPWRP